MQLVPLLAQVVSHESPSAPRIHVASVTYQGVPVGVDVAVMVFGGVTELEGVSDELDVLDGDGVGVAEDDEVEDAVDDAVVVGVEVGVSVPLADTEEDAELDEVPVVDDEEVEVGEGVLVDEGDAVLEGEEVNDCAFSEVDVNHDASRSSGRWPRWVSALHTAATASGVVNIATASSIHSCTAPDS